MKITERRILKMFTLTPKSFPQLLSGQIPQFCRVSAVPRHPALPCSSQTCAVTFPFPFGLLPHAHCLEVGDSPSSLLLLSFKVSALEASSPVQLQSSTLPLLPPCIEILIRSKSLNPGDLNWKLHPEASLTPGYNPSFSQKS